MWCNYIFNMKWCSSCNKLKALSNFHTNNNKPDKLSSYCKYCVSDTNTNYYKNNIEKVSKYNKEYAVKNFAKLKLYRISKEHDLYINNKTWVDKNREIKYAHNTKRRASKLKATPKWYEKELIIELYNQSSKETHIDHIIPLVNDLICGLHCIDNLQAISAKENLEKSNKLYTNYVEDLIMYDLALNGLASYEFMEDY